LNSETDEVGDYVRQLKSGDFQPSGVVAGAGALSDRDIRRVLALRTDISRETVTAALR
jgi:hypothetical protein